MAITSFDPGFVGAPKQFVALAKTTSRVAIAAAWHSVFDLAGNPGAGVLAGTSTAAGVVPNDATAGCPPIDAFGGGATGYLMQVDFGNSVACRMKLLDMVFKAGAYAFNANNALAAQPSYLARMPNGSYNDTQIWIETVTAFTGNPTFTITYTNQANVAGRTATITPGLAPALGRMMQVALQAGDSGVKSIDNVLCTIATVGTFNVLVLRPLWAGRCRIANDGDTHDLAKAGAVVYTDSALILAVCPDSTATGVPELEFVVANG